MTRITLLYFPVNNNSEPLRIRPAPLKISWFEARCLLDSLRAISVPPSGSSGRHVGNIESAQRFWFVLIQTDPATGKERTGLCFTVGARALRKKPEVLALIEILIEKAKQGQ